MNNMVTMEDHKQFFSNPCRQYQLQNNKKKKNQINSKNHK